MAGKRKTKAARTKATPARRLGTHEELLADYIRELCWAIGRALGDKQAEIGAGAELFREAEQLDPRAAREAATAAHDTERVATDPHVVGVIRKYWLLCDELNRAARRGKQVEPADFVSRSLVPVAPELAELLATLPYWPMGQDARGRWV